MMSLSRLMPLLSLLFLACRPADMYDQPKAQYYEPHPFFADHRSARPPIAGTVPRPMETPAWQDADFDPSLNQAPFPITLDDIKRGRERYEIYCTPCHGWTGEGNGMIVQRGYVQPPTFHQPSMQSKPLAHYVQVMSNGLRTMPSYAAQIPLRDRWLVAVYVRVLQSSRAVPIDSLSEDERRKLEEAAP